MGCLVCLSIVAYQTVMIILWEFIVFCAGMYWTQITQGHAGSPKIYTLPCSDKGFISACHAEHIVHTGLLGAGECRHFLSFTSTSSFPRWNRQDSPPLPSPYVRWPRSNTPCNCKLEQLLWVWAYEQDIPDRDLRKRIVFTNWFCFLSCDLSQMLVGKVGTILNKLAS